MAKRIIWSRAAVADRIQILDYWYRRLGTKQYSKNLDNSFRRIIRLIANHPHIGRKLEDRPERYFVKDSYQIFYDVQPDSVEILRIWDSRQNPADLDL